MQSRATSFTKQPETKSGTSTQQAPSSGASAAVSHAVQLRAKLNNGSNRKETAHGTTTKDEKGNGSWEGCHPIQVNLQQQLLEMFEDRYQSPILLVLGQKGGGKSFRMMTIIMYLIHNNIYDRYFFVLPTYKFEASNSYAWLAPFKDRVYVVDEYTPEITQAFMDRRDDTVPPHELPRTFLWLDDVGCNETFRNDRQFVSLLSIARHKRLSVALCYHSLTSGCTLNPFLRQNVTHTFLFRVTNEKLLESVFEELISMTGQFERFKDFRFVYNAHTCSKVDPATGAIEKNFNGLCINNALGCIDWEVAEWLPEESKELLKFLDAMKKEMEEEKIPAPKKGLKFEELEPEVVENVKPKPVVPVSEPEWRQILQASHQHPDWFYNGKHRFLMKWNEHLQSQAMKKRRHWSTLPPENQIHRPGLNPLYGGTKPFHPFRRIVQNHHRHVNG